MKKKFKYKFLTKADTLTNLKIKNGKIPKTYSFYVNNYKKSKKHIIKEIKKNFSKNIIVRSSNAKEDGISSSNAGRFQSILNVNPKNTLNIENAIDKVMLSYKNFPSSKNQILIQEMVLGVTASGVITTKSLKNMSPYFIIDIFFGKDTTVVTSGKGKTKKITIARSKKNIKEPYVKIINLAKELEKKLNNDALDIEFATSKSQIYLLQVRPIAKSITNKFKYNINEKDLKVSLSKLSKKIKKLQKPQPDLLGQTTYFGVMPDWNPAEIIGTKPKPLAISLYQELVTDHVWAESRKEFGFKDMTSHHLMTNFYGTPFIDIRVDFNSWIPKNLSMPLQKKLIKYYLEKFKRNLYLHDKVEFEILFTCFTPSSSKRLLELKKNNFTKKEINELKSNLKNINLLSISNIDKLIKKIELLKIKQKELSDLQIYPIDRIYWLIENCKKLGTYPFAGLARCGFIAIEILNSFVENKIFTIDDKEKYLKSIGTITSEFLRDKNKLSKKNFVEKYGHLRPDTYDILTKNYKEGFPIYFNTNKKRLDKNIKNPVFRYSTNHKKKINKFLKDNFGSINFNKLDNFIKKSIYFREYSKFVFSKNIDLIFYELKKLAKINKINHDELCFLEINDITKLYYNLNNEKISNYIKDIINKNKQLYHFNSKIIFPETICNENDISIFVEKISKVNFITNSSSVGKIKKLSAKNLNNLEGKIIAIQNADPGYDFIFNKKISALITKFGGANSHMAIRCSELGIPAAIGVGNKLFDELKNGDTVVLNCELEKIELI